MRKTLLLLAGIALLCSCKKEKPTIDPNDNPARGVFICNEGNYNSDNSSISFYDPATDKVTPQLPLLFDGAPFPLGDNCQSMVLHGGRGYIVVNNSAKIYVIDARTNAYRGKITGLTSPRNIHFVSDTKAYISDLYSTHMAIFNPQTLVVNGSIDVGRSTEAMVAQGKYLYVTSWSYNRKLYKIDMESDKVVDSLTVPLQPNSAVIDQAGRLWVLSDGSYDGSPSGNENAALTRINTSTFTIEQTLTFSDIGLSPNEMCISPDGRTIYYLSGWTTSGGLYAMSTSASALPTAPFVAAGERTFYGLGVNPVGGDLYVSDAIDYQQRGMIYRYSATGEMISSFKADIIPGSFCFKNDN